MKKIYLLIIIFISIFSSSLIAQNKKDSVILLQANALVKKADYKKALETLKKISTEGKKSKDFLVCRAICLEKSVKNKAAKNDYDLLYTSTGDSKFKAKSENILKTITQKKTQDSLRKHCKICKGKGSYKIITDCEECTKGGIYLGICNQCRGTGKENCNICGGTGKTTNAVTTTKNGVATITYVNSECNISVACVRCKGGGHEVESCNHCSSLGTFTKKVICTEHE